MLKTWRRKPYKPFFLAGIVSLLIALAYRYYSPESYFDLNLGEYLSLDNSTLWFIFTGYLFVLATVYYVSSRTRMQTNRWLVRAHFVFIVLFLAFFFTFTLFNAAFVRSFTQDIPFFVLFGIYGGIFLIDVLLFLTGIILLFANIIRMKRRPDPH